MLTPLALRVVSRIRCLNRSSDFGAIVRLMSGPAVKLNPRNFRSCGRATALFASFTLSLSFCVMKREMLSITPLTRAFAANVDVAVVRITNKAVSAALQLAVEFIEHEVTQRWRKRSSLRSAFHAGADQSVLHHPGIEECPDELQQPLVLDALGDLAHQFVVIDSIKELFHIEVDHPSVALRNILLRLSHGVMRRSPRSKPID